MEEAATYHEQQVKTFVSAKADMVTPMTMNYVEEALGIATAAKKHGMPVVVSFTTETDGKLPSGMTVQDAIELIDKETVNYPLYYAINCAHPSHFLSVLEDSKDQAWIKRLKGVRCNASKLSHAELDEATELDTGDIPEFGNLHADLLKMNPNLKVFGGCCGTDSRHVEMIFKSIKSI